MSGRAIFFCFLLCCLTVVVGCGEPLKDASDKAESFTLEDINGQTVRLSDYRNHVIILNFFATWCPPCRAEIPDFVELVNDYAGKRFVILGVVLDTESLDRIKSFAASMRINYPVLIDDGVVSAAYGPISSIPTTFIIDKQGNIVQKIIGSRSKSQFLELVEPLL
ncbi:MAG: TlpA family protein disulfide reductase [Candidatus Omnitrophica bacterium]|nr:TlpA family protein disulfide reductase [Candidatus Omnitrophota bacterium]